MQIVTGIFDSGGGVWAFVLSPVIISAFQEKVKNASAAYKQHYRKAYNYRGVFNKETLKVGLGKIKYNVFFQEYLPSS